MIDRDQVAAHLEFLSELGVTGVSRAPEWRTRVTPAVVAAPGDLPVETGSMDEAVPAVSALSAAEGLPALRAEIGPDCTRCKLHTLGRRQVVLARADAMEALSRVTHVALDKTGTLTEGRVRLITTTVLDGAASTEAMNCWARALI